HELHQIELSHGLEHGLHAGWEYFDAFFQLLAAGALLADKQNHNQTENVVKASMLASSAIALIAFTAKNGGFINSPAAVFAVAVDLSIATYEMLKAYKKTTFEGWLDDALAQLAFVDKQFTELEKKMKIYEEGLLSLREIQSKGEQEYSAYVARMHKENKNFKDIDDLEKIIREQTLELAKLGARASKLTEDITSRIKVYGPNRLNFKLRTFDSNPELNDKLRMKIKTAIETPITEKDKERDRKIQERLEKDFNQKCATCAYRLITLAAMIVTLALVPTVFVPLAMIAVSASIMLVKNGIRLYDHLSKESEIKPDNSVVAPRFAGS
ncbi:MAG TPA: hypothetical protein VHA13_03225, partial [Gammaproteobacteria bacterium]|nr:hypothetical protein [Gammaproteobacteria bacterium]